MLRRFCFSRLLVLCVLILVGCRQAEPAHTPPPPPSVTPLPDVLTIPTPRAPPQPLRLAAGTTGMTLPDEPLPAGGSAVYVLAAHAGQRLSVAAQPHTVADQPLLALRLRSVDEGTVLQAARAGVNDWAGLLPDDGFYELTVVNLGEARRFSFGLSLPERLNFVAGAISLAVEGNLLAGYTNDYQVTARAGQIMTVTLISPGEDVWLGVSTPEGQPLLRTHMGQTVFAGTLPVFGEYAIQVRMPGDLPSEPLPFTLTLDITD